MTIFQESVGETIPTMESLLRKRKLELWAAVCAHFKVTPKRKQQVHEWILEGRLQEELDAASNRRR
jgi:hypothetical protein